MTAPTAPPVRRATRHHSHTELPAKDPISVVAGPYGHPFHPILVTVPIGAWITSLVLDIGSRASDAPGALARGAWWAIGVGIVGALAAAVFGLLDLLDIPRRHTGLRHRPRAHDTQPRRGRRIRRLVHLA